MRILKDVLRKNRAALIVFLATLVMNTAVFALYGATYEPLIYAALLSFAVLAVLLVTDYLRERRCGAERTRALSSIDCEWRSLPEPRSLAEEDYQKMLSALGSRIEEITAEDNVERQDMLDYYTAWVHQIKTPIAVMRLKLSDDTPENHALSVELSRIEQYVDMALQYIRIGSETNDLVIREVSLDSLIRGSVRKLAPQFVEKRLKLCYTPADVQRRQVYALRNGHDRNERRPAFDLRHGAGDRAGGSAENIREGLYRRERTPGAEIQRTRSLPCQESRRYARHTAFRGEYSRQRERLYS